MKIIAIPPFMSYFQNYLEYYPLNPINLSAEIIDFLKMLAPFLLSFLLSSCHQSLGHYMGAVKWMNTSKPAYYIQCTQSTPKLNTWQFSAHRFIIWTELGMDSLSVFKHLWRVRDLKSLEDSLTTPAWHLMLAVGLDLCWGWGQNSHTKALHATAWFRHSVVDQFSEQVHRDLAWKSGSAPSATFC